MHGRILQIENHPFKSTTPKLNDLDMMCMNDDNYEFQGLHYFDYTRELDGEEYKENLEGFLKMMEDNDYADVHRGETPEDTYFTFNNRQNAKLLSEYNKVGIYDSPRICVVKRMEDGTASMCTFDWWADRFAIPTIRYYVGAMFDVHN